MGGSKGTTTTTTNSAPWKDQQNYLKYGFGEAKNLYKAPGPNYFPHSSYAGFSPEQQKAQQMGTARATAGSDLQRGATQYGTDVLAGKYLNAGNPFDTQVFGNIQSRVMPAVNANFANAGRYGSMAQGDTLTRSLTEAFSPYAAQNYQNERTMQQQMAGMAPDLAQSDYNDVNALYDIGTQKQNMAQNEINDAKARFDWSQQMPWNKVGQYMDLVRGNYGGYTTSQQPYWQPSMFSQIAGAGLGLLGMGG